MWNLVGNIKHEHNRLLRLPLGGWRRWEVALRFKMGDIGGMEYTRRGEEIESAVHA
jgi:hypothetical protein